MYQSGCAAVISSPLISVPGRWTKAPTWPGYVSSVVGEGDSLRAQADGGATLWNTTGHSGGGGDEEQGKTPPGTASLHFCSHLIGQSKARGQAWGQGVRRRSCPVATTQTHGVETGLLRTQRDLRDSRPRWAQVGLG